MNILRLLLAVLVAAVCFYVSRKNLRVALIFSFLSIYLSNKAYGLIGTLIFSAIMVLFILWCNYFFTKSWHNRAFIISMVLSSLYTAFQFITTLMKLMTARSDREIILKIAIVFVGIFFIITLIELKQEHKKKT